MGRITAKVNKPLLKSPKKAITLCVGKFNTLSGEGEKISGYWVRCWGMQRQLSVSSPALPLWEQRYHRVCKTISHSCHEPRENPAECFTSVLLFWFSSQPEGLGGTSQFHFLELPWFLKYYTYP